MSDKDPAEIWQLQNSGKTEDQWQLREAEQSVLDQLQLQPADADSPEWQPVDYVRPATSSRRWILPSIVTVLLLGVVGYMLWVGLGSLLPAITGTPAATAPETPPPGDAATPLPAVAAAVPAVTQEPTPTPVVEEPTPIPTEEPATATPALSPFVEQSTRLRTRSMGSTYAPNLPQTQPY